MPLFHFRLSTVDCRLSTCLLRRRIFRAKDPLRIVFPDPGVDEPGSFGDEVAAFFAALRFGQAMRIIELGRHADVVVLVPEGQRFGKGGLTGWPSGPAGAS